MKYIVAFLFLILSACATRQIPMEPSIYLLSTDKGPGWLLGEVAEDLKENKYKIETMDASTGLLVTEPRRFVILRGDERTYAEQTFQLRQEGGSIKVRLTYECDYKDGKAPCDVNDSEATTKIRRIERLLLAIINRRLYKKPGEERVKSKEI